MQQDTPSTLSKHDPFEAMRIAEFRHLMFGRFLFIMGLRMMGTLVGWWIYELTNEPFAIGLNGQIQLFPRQIDIAFDIEYRVVGVNDKTACMH